MDLRADGQGLKPGGMVHRRIHHAVLDPLGCQLGLSLRIGVAIASVDLLLPRQLTKRVSDACGRLPIPPYRYCSMPLEAESEDAVLPLPPPLTPLAWVSRQRIPTVPATTSSTKISSPATMPTPKFHLVVCTPRLRAFTSSYLVPMPNIMEGV